MSEIPESENEGDLPALDGGQGELLADAHRRRSDIRLIARAIRKEWPISPSVRELVVVRLADIVDEAEEDKDKIGAARALIAADGLNLKREQPEPPAATAVQVNVNTGDGATVNVQGILDDYRDVVAGSGVPAIASPAQRPGEQVHPAIANKAAGQVPS